jgi:hypothetical protein
MALDWGKAERYESFYEPQIIGASFRMPELPMKIFASPKTEVWNHVYTASPSARMATARR